MSFIIELLIFNQCSPGLKLEHFQNEAFSVLEPLVKSGPPPRDQIILKNLPILKIRHKLNLVLILFLQTHQV